MTYPKHTPLPDEEPPKPDYGRLGGDEGGDSVPDHGLVGEYAENVRHQNENGGAAYRMTKMRAAPQEEAAFTSGQGRLFQPAVHRTEERYADPFDPLTLARDQMAADADAANLLRELSDRRAMQMRVDPGQHPTYFQRPRQTLTGDGSEPAGPPSRAEGRTIRSAVYRPEDRY
jgi:hypothetical protein